ncbi:unnamed protein product [Gongylonema pulchrum]|uniref:Transposase n=1 Tax=Gongylonema pulchrum TaxID=637853 RepID=A0A183DMC9_9BILA|nr:unnamed protein product [Gongylonema pulchrum]
MNGHLLDGTADESVSAYDSQNSSARERLKNYENDLRKRRELDERRVKEDAFLR